MYEAPTDDYRQNREREHRQATYELTTKYGLLMLGTKILASCTHFKEAGKMNSLHSIETHHIDSTNYKKQTSKDRENHQFVLHHETI